MNRPKAYVEQTDAQAKSIRHIIRLRGIPSMEKTSSNGDRLLQWRIGVHTIDIQIDKNGLEVPKR